MIHMVTLGTAFEDLDNELESMLDMISEALDLLEKDKKEEAMEMLADLEEAMLDFHEYEECEEEEIEVELEKDIEEPAPAKKPAAKGAKEPAAKETKKPAAKAPAKKPAAKKATAKK